MSDEKPPPMRTLRELELLQLDTSTREPVYATACPNGVFLHLSPDAYFILKELQAGQTAGGIAAELARLKECEFTSDQIDAAIDTIARQVEDKSQATFDQQLELQGYWFRLRLLPAPLVGAVARRLIGAFHPAVVALVAVLSVASVVNLASRPSSAPDIAAGGLIWAAILYLGSVIAHEFGHATACTRFGVAPGEIGLTLYWIYPAFFSDVNAAWRLKRGQRIVVNLGGLYFQAIIAVACLVAYQLVAWPPLLQVPLFIALSSLLMMNPFLKFDAYWVLADALGVPNLNEQSTRLLGNLARRVAGHSVSSPWPRPIAMAVTLFGIARLVFFSVVIVLLIDFVRRLPGGLASLAVLTGHLLAGERVAIEVLFNELWTWLPAVLMLIGATRALLRKRRGR